MAKHKLRVIPLGGLGEIGRNMMLLEYGDTMIAIDAGLMFPEEEMLGIDLVIPDLSYVLDRPRALKAIFLTHGHEDHIGALPYVLHQVQAPIYCTRLTAGLVEVRLKEAKLLKTADIHVIKPGETVNIGPFQVEPFSVAHSVPDSVGYGIRTPAGVVIHTGDFKLDHTPVMGQSTDLPRWPRTAARVCCCSWPTRPTPRSPATRHRSSWWARRSTTSCRRPRAASSSPPSRR